MNLDVLFCSVPYIDTTEPTMAPGVLKSVALRAGFTAKGIDLNIDICNQVESSPNKKLLQEFFMGEPVTEIIIEEVLQMIHYVSNRIVDEKPSKIGLSLLTLGCKVFTRWLCINLKTLAPNTPIFVGGPGIRDFINDKNNDWVETLRRDGLIDDFIIGDGEISVVEYLKGNKNYPGINSINWKQLENLNVFPHPDYDDYDWSKYADPKIPVAESRGCVRSCEFCDIIEHWTKFQGRTAENVFEEIVSQVNRYKVKDISMRNSLTNGNMKVFTKLVKMIGDYNKQFTSRNQQISWRGYFIIRSSGQHPEEMWQDIKNSNGYLMLGVESVIQRIRYQIGKKFDNVDIEYHLEMGKKYQVPMGLLMIVGYPGETRADFDYTKQWFVDHSHYAGDSVLFVNLSPGSVLPGTELYRKKDEYGIELGTLPILWIDQQLNITYQDKLNHFNELLTLVSDLGYNAPIDRQAYSLTLLNE
jgi:radical SAM superfamily enzyme YgiQ (UPF0313 family)